MMKKQENWKSRVKKKTSKNEIIIQSHKNELLETMKNIKRLKAGNKREEEMADRSKNKDEKQISCKVRVKGERQ